MASNSSNDSFWTKTSGICTIVGLVIGSLLTIVALWFTILSYRHMRKTNTDTPPASTISQTPSSLPATETDEPPPPYILIPTPRPKQPDETKKPGKLAASAIFDNSQDLAVEAKQPQHKRNLGRRRWFILLLILAILLAGGVVALAANISRIQALSTATSAASPVGNPNITPVSSPRGPPTSTTPGLSVSTTTARDPSTTVLQTVTASSKQSEVVAYAESSMTLLSESFTLTRLSNTSLSSSDQPTAFPSISLSFPVSSFISTLEPAAGSITTSVSIQKQVLTAPIGESVSSVLSKGENPSTAALLPSFRVVSFDSTAMPGFIQASGTSTLPVASSAHLLSEPKSSIASMFNPGEANSVATTSAGISTRIYSQSALPETQDGSSQFLSSTPFSPADVISGTVIDPTPQAPSLISSSGQTSSPATLSSLLKSTTSIIKGAALTTLTSIKVQPSIEPSASHPSAGESAGTAALSSSSLPTSVIFETSLLASLSLEVTTSAVFQTYIVYETSVETFITVQTSVVYETVSQTSTQFLTSMVLQISWIMSTSMDTGFLINTQSTPSTKTMSLTLSPTTALVIPTSTSTSLPPGIGEYLGCVPDNPPLTPPNASDPTFNRTLSYDVPASVALNWVKMATIIMCADACRGTFVYYGLEYGHQCWCGNTAVPNLQYYRGSGSSPNCSMPCAGDPDTICGGPWWLSLYRYT